MKTLLQERIHELGLGDLLADIFEPGSPLALLGAQALYLAEPVLTSFGRIDTLDALARRLEDVSAPDDEGHA